MGKQINVHFDQENQRLIIDSSDVQKGDYIELTNLTNFESYLKDQAINAYKDEIIKQFKDSEEFNQLQNKNAELINKLSEQQNQFNTQIKDVENAKDKEISQLQTDARLKASEYQNQINLLNQQLSNKARDAVSDFKDSPEFTDLKQKINELTAQNQTLNQQLNSAEINAVNAFKASDEYVQLCSQNQQLQIALKQAEDKAKNELNIKLANQELNLGSKFNAEKSRLETEYQNQLQAKDIQLEDLTKEISDLRIGRFILGTKAIGEDFENSCLNEYNNTMGQMVEDCLFYKANEVIRNHKPDFIFEVYPSVELAEKARELLDTNTSKKKSSQPDWLWKVVLEMKSEGIGSDDKNRRKNSEFLNKLEGDRVNNDANLAILVTELEKEDNFLIKKDPNYPNIIIVRPSAMIPVLQMVRMIALKFKNENLENIEFRQKMEIRKEFDEMKLEILNNSIASINKNLESILNEVSKLRKSAQNIEECVGVIMQTHLNTVKNKIENFKIDKILKQMDKLESSSINHAGLSGSRIELDEEDIKSERIKTKVE